jgi:hypothetical protein
VDKRKMIREIGNVRITVSYSIVMDSEIKTKKHKYNRKN